MVVGTKMAHCFPAVTHLKAARRATSVLPKPTSPHSSLSMGTSRSMSSLISEMHRSWSSVSSYSKWDSKSRCHSPSGGKAKPFCCIRWAYSWMSSLAMSFTALRTLVFCRCQSAPPKRLSFTAESSRGPMYLLTRSSWVTGTYKVSFLA